MCCEVLSAKLLPKHRLAEKITLRNFKADLCRVRLLLCHFLLPWLRRASGTKKQEGKKHAKLRKSCSLNQVSNIKFIPRQSSTEIYDYEIVKYYTHARALNQNALLDGWTIFWRKNGIPADES